MLKSDLEKARDSFPGACMPNPKESPHAYNTWVKRMALWAYANGPMLLGLADKELDKYKMPL